jgi:hypothetical protein
LCHNIYRHGQEVKGTLCAYAGNFFFPDGQGASAAMPVSVRGQPYGRLTRQRAYHGGLSLSIPEEISCAHHLTFALILCEASLQLSRSY